jgi:hypothetical protein
MHKWYSMAQHYLDVEPYRFMADTASFSGFAFDADDNGICTIWPVGIISSDVASSIARRVVTYISEHGLPTGLLLDVRSNQQLSIVRLSSLVDTLSGMGVPLAVLFGGQEQLLLADLLHNTLTQKDYVAYFTDRDEAYAYLRAGTSRDTPPQ